MSLVLRNVVMNRMPPSRTGIAKKMSEILEITASIQPPKYAAMTPKKTPTTATISVVSTPTRIEARAP